MKQIITLILLLMLLNGCNKDSEFELIQYNFDRFEFVDSIRAMNYLGEIIEYNRTLDPYDFLFTKNLGFEPADEIRLLSDSTARFVYTSERFGFLELLANYRKSKDEIFFDLEPINETSDSLHLTFRVVNQGLVVSAYGIQKYQHREEGLLIGKLASYDLFLSFWLGNMISTDTLYLQEFECIYEQ